MDTRTPSKRIAVFERETVAPHDRVTSKYPPGVQLRNCDGIIKPAAGDDLDFRRCGSNIYGRRRGPITRAMMFEFGEFKAKAPTWSRLKKFDGEIERKENNTIDPDLIY
ncbi:hypothetical protein OROMI_002794 [Orobanche minor]